MIQADVDLNSGTYADIWYRFDDVSNGYLIRMESDGDVYQVRYRGGSWIMTGSETYSTGGSIPVKIKLSDSATEVWINGTKEYDWGASSGSGGVAFGGWQAKFDNIKVGYDVNDDDDLDDAGDNLILDEDFSSTSDTFAYDDAGNLVKDSQFIYTYDAWHRLVTAVSAEDTDITIGTYTYDGLGRRIKKVVTNAGDLDGTELYFYGKGHQVIEVRDGSENMIRQVVHGTRYIDEVVLEILPDGVAWVHQDANYNVIALTDFASQVLEHTYYTPYGIQTVDQETYWGDYDGDGLVTEDEWDTDTDGQLDSGDTCWGSGPTGSCRLVDFDFDNDVDATDATRLAELDSTTTYRQPGQPYSAVGNTRAHQGLVYDAEIGSYSGRARQYGARLKRFMQRDPLSRRRHARVAYWEGMNSYACFRNNPFRWYDPSGRQAIPGGEGGSYSYSCDCSRPKNKSVPCCDGNGNCTACLSDEAQGRTEPVQTCIVIHELTHCDQFGGAGPNPHCSNRGKNCMPGNGQWSDDPPAGPGASPGGDALECEAHQVQWICIMSMISGYCLDPASAECQDLLDAADTVEGKIAGYCGD